MEGPTNKLSAAIDQVLDELTDTNGQKCKKLKFLPEAFAELVDKASANVDDNTTNTTNHDDGYDVLDDPHAPSWLNNVPCEVKRSGYMSVTLSQLKNSMIQNRNNSTTATINKNDDDNSNGGEQIKVVPLEYNESMLSFIALSSFPSEKKFDPPTVAASYGQQNNKSNGKKRKLRNRNNNTATTGDAATATNTYRRCSICRLYGHYEVECEHLTNKDVQDLFEVVSSLQAAKLSNNKCKTCSLSVLGQSQSDESIVACISCSNRFHRACLRNNTKAKFDEDKDMNVLVCETCIGVREFSKINTVDGYCIEEQSIPFDKTRDVSMLLGHAQREAVMICKRSISDKDDLNNNGTTKTVERTNNKLATAWRKAHLDTESAGGGFAILSAPNRVERVDDSLSREPAKGDIVIFMDKQHQSSKEIPSVGAVEQVSGDNVSVNIIKTAQAHAANLSSVEDIIKVCKNLKRGTSQGSLIFSTTFNQRWFNKREVYVVSESASNTETQACWKGLEKVLNAS